MSPAMHIRRPLNFASLSPYKCRRRFSSSVRSRAIALTAIIFFIDFYYVVIFCHAGEGVRCIVAQLAPLTESPVAMAFSVGWIVGVTPSHCHYPCVHHFISHLRLLQLILALLGIRHQRGCGCTLCNRSDARWIFCLYLRGVSYRVRISSCSSSYTIIFGSTPECCPTQMVGATPRGS